MRATCLLLPVLAAALLAPAAAAQCPEPSALDRSPGSTPLRVEKAAGGDLRVSWESVMADGYRLHRGRLDRLFVNSAYDHRVVDEPVDAELVLDEGNRDWYFVVASDCRASDSGVGRDSGGDERPFGGLISVRVGLQGGTAVAGTEFTMLYPAGFAFTDDDAVSFLGPYAPGAPGSAFGAANTNAEGRVVAAVATIPGDFDPPPDMPLEVAEILFGYHGVPPAAGEFSLSECSNSDTLGNLITEVVCSIAGFDVLF